jgi:hypothetical protein
MVYAGRRSYARIVRARVALGLFIAEGNVYASVVGDPDELFAYAAGTGARRWSTNFAPSAP